uniref:Lactamase_B domain-containing protein n=1 Tax=Panagrellus redivivus TaxID=6233 RepID=A0A7E5A0P9_PANRE
MPPPIHAIPIIDVPIVYLTTPKTGLHIISKDETPEAAIAILSKAAPPTSVHTVFFMPLPGLQTCQNYIQTLKKAGYNSIESIELSSLYLSARILNLPLSNCAIGEPVIVFIDGEDDQILKSAVGVIKKCQDGWQVCSDHLTAPFAVAQHPSVRNVVISKGLSAATIDAIKKLCPGREFHFSQGMPNDFRLNFIANRLKPGLLKGYEVLPYCSADLFLKFGNKYDEIKLTDRVPPFIATKVIDVGDASEIIVKVQDPNESKSTLKTFSFKTKALRTVSMTVKVDKSLLPEVTMKTVATHKPPDHNTPVIYLVKCIGATYFLEAILSNRVSEEGFFKTLPELMAHMVTKFAISTTAAVYFIYTIDSIQSDLQDFHNACQESGYPNVKFIPNESMNISFLLDRAKMSIQDGQLVAVVCTFDYCVFGRDGKRLRIFEKGQTCDFDPKKSKVDIVIIENSTKSFTKTDLDYFRDRFSQCNVHIVSGMEQLKAPMPKYYWSLVNGTDFGGNLFNNFGDFDFIIEGKETHKRLETCFCTMPYTVAEEFEVDFTRLRVYIARGKNWDLFEVYHAPPGTLVRFIFVVESAFDVTVKMEHVKSPNGLVKPGIDAAESIDDDEVPKPSSSPSANSDAKMAESVKKTLDPPSETVLTFTNDNRVLIQTGQTYVGDKEILAYVRLRRGMAPEVGKCAFDALKWNPDSVFYDITRLLAIDFNPDQPDPEWRFQTSRDTDGNTVISTKGGITTFPIVLFGLVVRSTQLYIQKHSKFFVTSLGLRLPEGSVISDSDLRSVADKIGVELVLVV